MQVVLSFIGVPYSVGMQCRGQFIMLYEFDNLQEVKKFCEDKAIGLYKANEGIQCDRKVTNWQSSVRKQTRV